MFVWHCSCIVLPIYRITDIFIYLYRICDIQVVQEVREMEDEKCGCGQANCDCGSQCSGGSCGSGCGEMDYLRMIVYLAKEAKAEMIKDKIKTRLEKTHGKKLDKIADIAVEALQAKCEMGNERQKKMEELNAKLDAVWEEK